MYIYIHARESITDKKLLRARVQLPIILDNLHRACMDNKLGLFSKVNYNYILVNYQPNKFS